ncbi:MAG: hypothetical protein Q8K28_05240 [Hoeflea sp.]|uniref:sunset domain-containing protein n=1 Tax=Hoeflea sp. TaxID=1940281 RepID=UPI0027306713|nr:hypothetical protein [Hoeflea sp.]MDP2119290.1 hypothetical protein [Hoeflea sp.]
MARFASLVILVSAGAFAAPFAFHAATSGTAAVGGTQACVIKGNISIKSRERIYHVPGQEYYDATRISPEYGERWFCTETEARAAGWRKAGR